MNNELRLTEGLLHVRTLNSGSPDRLQSPSYPLCRVCTCVRRGVAANEMGVPVKNSLISREDILSVGSSVTIISGQRTGFFAVHCSQKESLKDIHLFALMHLKDSIYLIPFTSIYQSQFVYIYLSLSLSIYIYIYILVTEISPIEE